MRKKKRSPKKYIALGLVVVLIAGFVTYLALSKEEKQDSIQIETVQKRTIANTISATGTINSSTSKSITSNLQGMKIDKIYISAGEYVQEDQILLEFDVSALEDAIESAKETRNQLYEQKKQIENSLDLPNLDLSEIKTQIDKLEKEITELETELESKTIELNEYKTIYETNKKEFDLIQAEYNKYIEDITKAQNDVNLYQLTVNSKKIAYDKYFKEQNGEIVQVDTNGNVIPKEDYELDNFATALHETVYNEYNNALEELNQLKDIVDEKNNLKTLFEESTYNRAQKDFTNVQAKYIQLGLDQTTLENKLTANKTQLSLLKTAQNQLENLQGSLDFSDSLSGMTSTIDASISQIDTQITLYEKQVENKVVKAPTSGLLTSLNVKEGDTYLGTTIATIEGETQFIITSYIGEYDIPDVETGMRVLIKTDATRNEELEGEIIFVSPSSSSSSSSSFGIPTSSGGAATYKVDIAIISQNDRLRLGMNARLSIITEMKDDVLTVPYDAIHERDDGTKYVEIMNDNESITEVDVVTGLEGSYYIEVISGNIREGMNVVLPKSKTGSGIEDLIGNMGAGGGLK